MPDFSTPATMAASTMAAKELAPQFTPPEVPFSQRSVRDVGAGILNSTGSRAGATVLSALVPALAAGGLAWAARKGLINVPYAEELGLTEISPWRPALAAGLVGGTLGAIEFAPKNPRSLSEWLKPGWGSEYLSGPRIAPPPPATPTAPMDKTSSYADALNEPGLNAIWQQPSVPVRSLKDNIWDTPFFSPDQKNFMFKAVDYGTGRAKSGLTSLSDLQSGAEEAMSSLPGDTSLSTLLLRPALQSAESALIARGLGYLGGLSGNVLNLATGGGAVYGLLKGLPTMRNLQ